MAANEPDDGPGREAYEQGRRAFREGVRNRYNPHPSRNGHGLKRQRWFDGWYDEKLKRFYEGK
jgi:hypothetical protein